MTKNEEIEVGDMIRAGPACYTVLRDYINCCWCERETGEKVYVFKDSDLFMIADLVKKEKPTIEYYVMLIGGKAPEKSYICLEDAKKAAQMLAKSMAYSKVWVVTRVAELKIITVTSCEWS